MCRLGKGRMVMKLGSFEALCMGSPRVSPSPYHASNLGKEINLIKCSSATGCDHILHCMHTTKIAMSILLCEVENMRLGMICLAFT